MASLAMDPKNVSRNPSFSSQHNSIVTKSLLNATRHIWPMKPIHEVIQEERTNIIKNAMNELLATIVKDARGPKSKQVLEESLKYESLSQPRGGWPVVVARGKNEFVWDVDGNEYIDLAGGFTVLNCGHCNPEVIEAVKNQCEKLTFPSYVEGVTEVRTKLAKRLVELSPGDHKRKVHFMTTGGEAIETSMKFARFYTGRPLIIAFYGAYHGRTAGAESLTANAYYSYIQGGPMTAGIVHIPYAYCFRCIFNMEYPDCDVQCTKFLEELFKSPVFGKKFGKITNVSSILVEPMQGVGGCVIPPKEFLQELRRIADENSVLLIADEIQTGLGRTGRWWGCDHSDVDPDMFVVSKHLALGIPLSAVVGRSEIMDNIPPKAHISTFGGTPVACAAGLKVLEIIEKEGLVDRADKMGKYFLDRLNDLSERHPIVQNLQGKGLFIGFDLVKDKKSKKPAVEEQNLLNKECLKRGLLIATGGYYNNRVTIRPPLTIEKESIDKAVDILDESLAVIEKKG